MARHARMVGRIAGLVAVLAASLIAQMDGRVSACSCVVSFPSVADEVGQADIAFVGTLLSHETLDPPVHGASDEFDLRYELLVEHAVKGVVAGDRVVMFGSTAQTSCGTSELDTRLTRYPIIATDSGRFVADSTSACGSTPTVSELLAVDRTLPTTGPGPVSVVVVGRLGEAELVAYDAGGRPVAYGDLPPDAGHPAVCPSSARFVQFERTPSSDAPVLTVRDTATLSVLDRLDLLVPGATVSAELAGFIVNHSTVTCVSPSGDDVVVVLSWEHAPYGQTRVIRVRPDDAGGITLETYGHASRARYDAPTQSVVAVSNGALVRYPTPGGAAEPIAQLTDPSEAGYDALFVEPDGSGGWWVGLGDGDYDLATTLHVLTHVSADGSYERWPVQPPIEAWGATIVDNMIHADGHVVELPTLGSSTGDLVIRPVEHEASAFELRLADGRSVRPVDDGQRSFVELVNVDGTTVELAHLLEARFASSIPDGPTTDPATIEREAADERFESRWIVRDDAEQPSETTIAQRGPAATGGANPGGEESPKRGDPRAGVPWTVVGGLAVGLAAIVTALFLRSRRSIERQRGGGS